MKNLSLITLLLALSISSCTKKDSSTTTPTPTAGITFKVDGTSVTCDSANAVLYTYDPLIGRMIDVYAYKGGIQVLEFHFQPKTGTVPADKTFNNSWLTYWSSLTDYFDSKSGTLKLTKCDTTTNNIEATFDFIGENSGATATHSITEGTMSLTKITKH